jgi:1-acyl-sn-glycerol-3-phosphate acyltransferase
MIRTIFVWSCIALSGFFFGSLAILSYLLDRKGEMAHVCARLWGKACLLADGIQVRIEGLEQVPDKGPYIFMSNHQGSYDIFALMGRLPFQFKWLSKKEIFSIPIIGWAMSAAGYISIDREGTRETVEAMNKAARKIQEGASVVIFPEGTRSADGSIQPFKKGGFTLAVKSKVPIVPIAISGSREIMAKGRLTIHPGDIRVRIGPPIETAHCSTKDRQALMDRVREAISSQFKVISGGHMVT